ncbi:hypothetical protein [Phenylobacterium sp.]|uniref:hypothetical protein n=1 Tax=Phenylobacterium sp. TaxID=1871053 RepID=UPI002BB7B406|nr:hypothetical protein [Phenylobacterium sp.]HLZ73777.1 hypothetical protein [Phenylobacterium sp.]
MLDRRAVTAGLIGLGALPGRATAAQGVVEGEPTWSESAMVLYFDPDARNGLSLRISRYPERGKTWVWLHLLADGVLYTFTDSQVPSSADKITAELPSATYPSPGLKASISRVGTSGDLKAMSFRAELGAHRGTSGTDGPGAALVSVEGVFHPGQLLAGSPKGRFEHTGRVEATLRAAGKTIHVGGVGKAHEQTQTNPRFTAPFTYAMLWSADSGMIGLLSPGRGYGDLDLGGQDTPMERFRIEPWSPKRRFAALLKDGRSVEGSAETVVSYQVPIFGRQWSGNVVRAQVAGHPMVGMINDWKPKEQPYGLS